MIRRAESSDVADLARLLTQLGYPATDAEMDARWEAIASRPDFATLLAVEGQEIRGMIGLSTAPSYTHNERVGRIVVLVVDEEKRGRGVGAELVAAAETYFREQGIRRMRLTTRTERADAHRFYERLGFGRTGLRFEKTIEASL